MKYNVIHDLINSKARRLEIEVGLGISNVENSHLSRAQLNHIHHDFEDSDTHFSTLNYLNTYVEVLLSDSVSCNSDSLKSLLKLLNPYELKNYVSFSF